MIGENCIYFLTGCVTTITLLVIISIIIHYKDGTLFVKDKEGEQNGN